MVSEFGDVEEDLEAGVEVAVVFVLLESEHPEGLVALVKFKRRILLQGLVQGTLFLQSQGLLSHDLGFLPLQPLVGILLHLPLQNRPAPKPLVKAAPEGLRYQQHVLTQNQLLLVVDQVKEILVLYRTRGDFIELYYELSPGSDPVVAYQVQELPFFIFSVDFYELFALKECLVTK